jgi:hypothetical protein
LKSSNDFRFGKPADRIRVAAPEASRAETSRESTAARYSSWVQPGNDYSVDPSAIGQLVDVTTTLAQVTVTRSGRLLAVHDRCWAVRQTLTDPAHVAAAAALRQQFQAGTPPAVGDQLVRDLADYDRAFGVDFSAGTAMSDGEVA